jgi:hypothetical protein
MLDQRVTNALRAGRRMRDEFGRQVGIDVRQLGRFNAFVVVQHRVRRHNAAGIRNGVMHLRDHRRSAAFEAVDDPRLPQRPVQVERFVVEFTDQVVELCVRTRRFEHHFLDVVANVEGRVEFPNMVVQAKRDGHGALPVTDGKPGQRLKLPDVVFVRNRPVEHRVADALVDDVRAVEIQKTGFHRGKPFGRWRLLVVFFAQNCIHPIARKQLTGPKLRYTLTN